MRRCQKFFANDSTKPPSYGGTVSCDDEVLVASTRVLSTPCDRAMTPASTARADVLSRLNIQPLTVAMIPQGIGVVRGIERETLKGM